MKEQWTAYIGTFTLCKKPQIYDSGERECRDREETWNQKEGWNLVEFEFLSNVWFGGLNRI